MSNISESILFFFTVNFTLIRLMENVKFSYGFRVFECRKEIRINEFGLFWLGFRLRLTFYLFGLIWLQISAINTLKMFNILIIK